MKKEAYDYVKMLLGVLAGITGTLILTLNIWGHEWYKVIASISIGAMIGLLITDPKVFAQIIVVVFKRATIVFEKKEKIKPTERQLQIRKLRRVYLVYFAPMIIFCLFVVWRYLFYQDFGYPTSWAVIYFSLLPVAVLSCATDYWRKQLNDTEKRKIWKIKPDAENDQCNLPIRSDGEIDMINLIEGMTFWQIEKGIFLSMIIVLYRLTKKAMSWIIFKSQSICGFVFACLPLIPFWFIQELSKHGRLLVAAFGIITGGLIGTLTHSYFYGLDSGLIFLLLAWFLKPAKNIAVFYLFKRGKMIDKIFHVYKLI